MSTQRYLTSLHITGPDAKTFLQSHVTCDLNTVSACALTTTCTLKGRMVATFWLISQGDDYLLILPHNMPDLLITHWQKYAAFSKVEFKEDTHAWLTLDFKKLDPRILADETPKNITSNNNEWLLHNIKERIVYLTPETSEKFTPQMIALEKTGDVSFSKGCYLGQEIVTRTEHLGKLKRHLHELKFDTDKKPNIGDPVMTDDNKNAGTIVSVAKNDNAWVVLAVIQDAFGNVIPEITK